MGRLPEQAQANLQMVSGMRQQQDSTTMSLRTEQDRLAMLERQIEAMKRGASDAPLSKARGSSPQERVAVLRRQLDEAAAITRRSTGGAAPEGRNRFCRDAG